MTKVEIIEMLRETSTVEQIEEYIAMTYNELLEMYWDVDNPARINEGV